MANIKENEIMGISDKWMEVAKKKKTILNPQRQIYTFLVRFLLYVVIISL